MGTTNPAPVKKTGNRFLLPGLIVGGFLILAIVLSITSYNFIRQMVMGWSISSLPGEPVVQVTGAATMDGNPTATPIAEAPAAKPWSGKNRINILFLGLDFRDWEKGETPRTDTMILASYDPVTGQASTLTIPRDLWVNIPGFDFGKINTAYYLGEVYHLPGGGPSLAMKTVSDFLGVPIDYYVQLDFNTFIKLIDLIGGVIITPDQDVKLERIGHPEWQEFLKAGQTVTLDGALTLSYARDRYTEKDDFDRSRRQQQVILAIRNRLLQFNNLPKLISKAPALYNEFSSGIKTNLDLQQIIQLGSAVVNLPKENLHQSSISPAEVQIGTSPDGLSILIPIPDEIRNVRDSVFTTAGSASPLAGAASAQDAIRQEAAKINIYNGSGTPGLAQKTADMLSAMGITVVNSGDAGVYQATSSLAISNSKPYAINAIAQLLKMNSSQIQFASPPDPQVDLTLILGQDWANANP